MRQYNGGVAIEVATPSYMMLQEYRHKGYSGL
jgi:hypothetical protein